MSSLSPEDSPEESRLQQLHAQARAAAREAAGYAAAAAAAHAASVDAAATAADARADAVQQAAAAVEAGLAEAAEDAVADAHQYNLIETFTSAPVARGVVGLPHPTRLRTTSALASVTPPSIWLPSAKVLPAELLRELRLSAEQVESVLLATQSHEMRLPGRVPMRRAFLLGDAAGVGKGRQLAATALAALISGKARKFIWVSVSADLALDAARDVLDLLGPEGFSVLPVYRLADLGHTDLDALPSAVKRAAMVAAKEVLRSRGEGGGAVGGGGGGGAEGDTDEEEDRAAPARALKTAREALEAELARHGTPSLKDTLRGVKDQLRAEGNAVENSGIRCGIVFCTYTSLAGRPRKSHGLFSKVEGAAPKKGAAAAEKLGPYEFSNHMAQLLSWVGGDFSGCLLLDESHKAKNLSLSKVWGAGGDEDE